MTDMLKCPICDIEFKPADVCAEDIEMGTCHAECLQGSPVVDLDTGEEMPEGSKVDTYFFAELDDPAQAGRA
jgi:Zn-finger nucleic acid-binding protein